MFLPHDSNIETVRPDWQVDARDHLKSACKIGKNIFQILFNSFLISNQYDFPPGDSATNHSLLL